MTKDYLSISKSRYHSIATPSLRLRETLTLILCSVFTLTATAGPSVFPTGTTRYAPSKAYNSFVLFSGGDDLAHLIDMNGNSVHEWKDPAGHHSTLIDPELIGGKRGHILVTLENTIGKGTG